MKRWAWLVGSVGCLALSPRAARADVADLGAAADNTLYQDATGSLSNGAGQYVFAGSNGCPTAR